MDMTDMTETGTMARMPEMETIMVSVTETKQGKEAPTLGEETATMEMSMAQPKPDLTVTAPTQATTDPEDEEDWDLYTQDPLDNSDGEAMWGPEGLTLIDA